MYNGENLNGFNQDPQYNNFNNNPKNKKNKNTGMIVAIIICTFILIGTLTIAGVTIANNINLGSGTLTKNTEETSNAQENKSSYEDIGNTVVNNNATQPSGSVVVTDASGVVSQALPSVVAITSETLIESNYYMDIYEYYFGGGGNEKGGYTQEAAGSGIIVDQTDSELLIVTNNHVVEGADSLKIQFSGMSTEDALDGYVKGTDAGADVAVVAVKLSDIPQNTLKTIKKATLGDSDALQVGEGVIAIGNALGYGQSVTTGVISAKDRKVKIDNNEMTLLQTDAAINGGNSGGALLNAKGEVIGINVAKYSSNGSDGSASIEGMGFAIPISSVKNIISTLETKETRTKVDEAERGYLGIQGNDVTEEISEQYNMPAGVQVGNVTKNGPADKAGIEKTDVITKFDGQTVTSMSTLQGILEYYKAGEKVEVTIRYRKGREYEEKTVTVTLGDSSVLSN